MYAERAPKPAPASPTHRATDPSPNPQSSVQPVSPQALPAAAPRPSVFTTPALRQKSIDQIVQRYSQSIFTSPAPTDWDATTATVTRSAAGVTGVFFFHKNPDDPTTVNEVVVKPVYVAANLDAMGLPENDAAAQDVTNSQASSKFADQLLDRVGVNANQGRIIADAAEVQAIRAVVAAKGNGAQMPPTVASGPNISVLKYMRVSPKEQGFRDISGIAKSGAEASRAAGASDAPLHAVLNTLSNKTLMERIGLIVAVDAFMKNEDRVSVGKGNIGNIMINGVDVRAIDNDSAFAPLRARGLHYDPDFDRVEEVLSQRAAIIGKFFVALSAAMRVAGAHDKSTQEERFDQIAADPNLPARVWLDQGIQLGVNQLRTFLMAPANKPAKRNLRTQATQWSAQGATNMNWTAFRAREKYLKLRTNPAGPNPAATAAAGARSYADYRTWKVAQYPALMAGIVNRPNTMRPIKVRPPEMKGRDKLARAFHPATSALSPFASKQRAADKLKKQERADEADLAPAQVAQLEALANEHSDAARTAKKALFERQHRELIAFMQGRQAMIRNLLDGAQQKAAGGVGEQGKFLAKRMAANQPDRVALNQFLQWKDQLVNEWTPRFDPLPEEDALSAKKKAKLTEELNEKRAETFNARNALDMTANDLKSLAQ